MAATMTPHPGRTGRPQRLTEIVEHDPDGTPVTLATKIVAMIRDTGIRPQVAALSLNVDPHVIDQWLRDGHRAAVRLYNPPPGQPPPKLPANEQRLMEFASGCRQAFADWHLHMRGTLQRLADGGIEQVVITETTDADGKTTRSERRQVAMPDPKVANRLLEVTIPETYHLPTVLDVHVTGDAAEGQVAPGMGMVEQLREAMERRREGLAVLPAEVIDTTGRDG